MSLPRQDDMCFRSLTGAHVRLLGVVLSALAVSAAHASTRPMKFDLICHYVRASGHEVWSGSPHDPYRGPRVRRIRIAIAS
jgi:hypothetical protein